MKKPKKIIIFPFLFSNQPRPKQISDDVRLIFDHRSRLTSADNRHVYARSAAFFLFSLSHWLSRFRCFSFVPACLHSAYLTTLDLTNPLKLFPVGSATTNKSATGGGFSVVFPHLHTAMRFSGKQSTSKTIKSVHKMSQG